MTFGTRTVVLAISSAAAVGLAGLIYWWDPAPPPPADALIHQHYHSILRTASAAAKKEPEPAPIPAASTAAPPAEAWLPPSLTAKELSYRAAADAVLMKSELLDRFADTNAIFLQKEVVNGQYADVDTQLDNILAKAVIDSDYDLVERDASGFADGGGSVPELNNETLDDWLSARPHSSWAHLSAAKRLFDRAWEVRGQDFADKISAEQWKDVHRYAAKARTETKKSLKLNPRSAVAWLLLIQIDQVDSGPTASDYRAALQHRPGNILIPDGYQGALQPRWGGSYEQMHAAAQGLLDSLEKNPRLWSIGGFAAADAAYGHQDDSCDSCSPPDWTAMLKNYNAALAYGDHTYWLSKAGWAALHLHRYALAYRYYERAYAYAPDTPGWKDQMEILRMLCDPKFPRRDLETYEQEAVAYGMTQTVEHPRVAGDCKYYQAELPWSDEPIPAAGSIEPYYLLVEARKRKEQ